MELQIQKILNTERVSDFR